MLPRRRYFIDKEFQKIFIIKFSLLVVLSSTLFMTAILYFSRDVSTVSLVNTQVSVKKSIDFILPIVSLTFIAVVFIALSLALLLTLTTSHKISGPLYRCLKEIELITRGDLTGNFNTRDNDQLKQLSSALEDMRSRLRTRQQNLEKSFASLRSFLVAKEFRLGPKDSDECIKRIKEVQSLLSEFNV